MTYKAEFTDTFGGNANYCWVRRADIEADTLKSALRKARAEFGLTGIKGDITADFGDEIHWMPRGICTVIMVRWDY